MGIKLKYRNKEIFKILAWCAVGLLACFLFYYFIDHVWNGMFADWFMKKYMTEYDAFYMDERTVVREPIWPEIKNLLFLILCFIVVLGIIIVYEVSHYYAKWKAQKMITDISMEISAYMGQTENQSTVFPKEHAEIYAQMSEIKSTMQHHEQILKEETARKNDLIVYLAHDLKTPLTSIIGYLSLLEEIADMPQEQKEKYIKIALGKAKRLEVLINEFFEITRYNLQQIQLEKESIDLYYMFQQLTDEFYPLLNAHGNSTKLEIDQDITIYGDPDKLARVFNNILKNAIAYSYYGTEIKIWSENSESEIRIFFQNKGKTIPEQKLNVIFEKFFRLDESRGTNTGGAGLGLAIAKEIINLHGGKISVKSENECTTFCISLPKNNVVKHI